MRSPDEIQELQRSLLAWFRAEKRDLPWRRTRDPYAIWISEVMCQQTQVATVIPYWERFLARFSTVTALASAPVDDVFALWSGLGYYARARNLHKAAQAIVEQHGGRLPADPDALAALPGFGPYTAGAVGSIALNLDVPLVDGNVARVLCRLEGWTAGAEEAREKAWKTAGSLVPSGDAGDWNQALMELGATVCTPVSPKCDVCPGRKFCKAAKRGDPAKYPLPKERRPRKLLRFAALALRKGDAVLLTRLAEGGLFGGLWSLPVIELDVSQPSVAGARDLARTFWTKPGTPKLIGQASQALTHRDVEIEIYAVEGTRPRLPDGARWVLPEGLPSLGLSSLAVKALQAAHVPVPNGHGRRRAMGAGQRSLW